MSEKDNKFGELCTLNISCTKKLDLTCCKMFHIILAYWLINFPQLN